MPVSDTEPTIYETIRRVLCVSERCNILAFLCQVVRHDYLPQVTATIVGEYFYWRRGKKRTSAYNLRERVFSRDYIAPMPPLIHLCALEHPRI